MNGINSPQRLVTTPSEITEPLMAIAKAVIGGDEFELQYVSIVADDGAKPNRSHDNVKNYLKSNDGEVAYCWAFYENACWIEAAFHSVVRLSDGTLLDITPGDGIKRRLIAIDHERVLGQFRITHKYHAKGESDIVKKFISLMKQRNQVFYGYSDGLALNRHDAELVKAIDAEIERVVGGLLQLAPDLAPNNSAAP